MKLVKEALQKFLKYDYTIELDADESSISGYDKIVWIGVTAPCIETHNYWVLRIYPKVLVDFGVASEGIKQYFWTVDDVIEYLGCHKQDIFDWLLYFLSKEYTELQHASEVLK